MIEESRGQRKCQKMETENSGVMLGTNCTMAESLVIHVLENELGHHTVVREG